MQKDLPLYISVIFICTVVLTVVLLYYVLKGSANRRIAASAGVLMIPIVCWLMMQASLASYGIYYNNLTTIPPKIMIYGILPAGLFIMALFVSKKGKKFIDSLPMRTLTFLHIIRIPVEIGLFLLFTYGAVPKLMTFEGVNFDVLSGITAPVVAYFGFNNGKINHKILLTWNLLCLALLINVVVIGVFSAPTPMQQFAFDQPNTALLNFPYCWLPTFIVPAVLFSHLVTLRKLLIPSMA
ncbi:MAG TPA: hypothetical protein VN040_14315 [Pseudosphingobacterium sp.]|nr:hypothetical protein [Pseudosphingobacterium sp.]